MATNDNDDQFVAEAQGRTHGSLSGPALSIISSNIEGLSGAKQELLADLCITTNCDILCLIAGLHEFALVSPE